MAKQMLLMMMGLSLLVGGFWAGQAQDPAPQNPSNVRTDPPTATANTVQTDLSGTYAGMFNCDALGLTGDTTLTINGNEFTTADGKTGRIVASTTGGYTAVALQMGGTTPAATPATGPAAAPMIVSLRARKSSNRLTLTSASGAAQKCSFTSSRNVARGRRNQRTPAAVPAATGAEVGNPAPVPSAVPAENPMPSQTPSPNPTPSPSPTPSGTPAPSPSPSEPMPSPTPSPGEPMPSPTPSPGEPMPSPTPTPSPSPSPSPRA
jgi:hypothetical protein